MWCSGYVAAKTCCVIIESHFSALLENKVLNTDLIHMAINKVATFKGAPIKPASVQSAPVSLRNNDSVEQENLWNFSIFSRNFLLSSAASRREQQEALNNSLHNSWILSFIFLSSLYFSQSSSAPQHSTLMETQIFPSSNETG